MARVLSSKLALQCYLNKHSIRLKNMNIEDYILALAAKKLANEASEEELLKLDELLQQYPNIRENIKLMTEWWHRYTEQSTGATSYFRFQKILEQIKNNNQPVQHNETLWAGPLKKK